MLKYRLINVKSTKLPPLSEFLSLYSAFSPCDYRYKQDGKEDEILGVCLLCFLFLLQ